MGLYGNAPKTPDPKETAAAQTATNIGTAIANGYLGNVNQVTPDGSLTYSQTGTNKWTDPQSGDVYDLPTWTATTSLSPAQQAIKAQEDAASKNLATLANTQSGRLNTLLANPFTMNGAPAAGDASSLRAPSYQQFGAGPQLQTSLGNTGTVQNSIAGAGGVQSSLGTAGNINNSIANAGNLQTSVANAGNIQSSFGNAGPVERAVANSGNVQTGVGNGGDITRSYNVDFDTSKYENALMDRLNPQLAQSREALETKLINQGLQPGSQAFDRAIDAATRQENDARIGAVLNAGQEQSRLAGLAANQAGFQNSAQNQAYQQGLSSGQFANSAQAQQYAQNANNLQLSNAAQAQQFGQNLQSGQFANTAQQQQYSQNANNMQLANAAQAQQYQQNANDAAFGNSAQSQKFGQDLQAGQFANSAQAQRFGQNTAQQQANNAAQQQAYQQALSNANLNNSSAQQMFSNTNSSTAANNALADQGFNSQQAIINAQNAARSNYLNENYAQRNQNINEVLGLASGAQVSNPNFVATQGQSIPTVDYAGLVNQDYQNRLAASQQSQGMIGSILGGVGSLFALSDEDAKKDIKKVGSLDGHGLYRYKYRGKHDDGQEHIGVIAQQVEKKRPDAVRRGADGLRRVDYGALFQAGAR